MRRFLLVAGISLAVLALPDGAVAKECNSFDEFYSPLTASERVPCRSARRVMRRCDLAPQPAGRVWGCRVLRRTWRCREIPDEDGDGIVTSCRSCRYRITWEWCISCVP